MKSKSLDLYKNMNLNPYTKKADGESWHNLSAKTIIKAIQGLNDPLFISENKNGIAVVTSIENENNRPIVVVFEKQFYYGNVNRVDCYRIKTITPKDKSLETYIKGISYNQDKGEAIILFNKKSSTIDGTIPLSSRTKFTIQQNSKNVKFTLENTNRPTYHEIVKNSANLKHEKVYSLKTTDQIVDNALVNMLNKWDKAIKISVPTGTTELKNFTFEELNLYKNKGRAIKNIAKEIEKAVVTFDNGTNGQEKVVLKNLDMHDELVKATAVIGEALFV